LPLSRILTEELENPIGFCIIILRGPSKSPEAVHRKTAYMGMGS